MKKIIEVRDIVFKKDSGNWTCDFRGVIFTNRYLVRIIADVLGFLLDRLKSLERKSIAENKQQILDLMKREREIEEEKRKIADSLISKYGESLSEKEKSDIIEFLKKDCR